jgi:hypothetical protein
MPLHLHVVTDTGLRNCELFSPAAHDFRWNADYTAFRPVSLLWHDDASYARYQSDDDEGQGDE